MASARADVAAVRSKMAKFRESCDQYHAVWYSAAVELAEDMDIEPTIPRRCSRQVNRANLPGTPEEYFRRVVTLPLLGKY